jgi:hypothetical protein
MKGILGRSFLDTRGRNTIKYFTVPSMHFRIPLLNTLLSFSTPIQKSVYTDV